MKPSNFSFALLGLLALFGCKKDRTPTPPIPPPVTLTQSGGYWVWEGSYGAQVKTPASTGIERHLRFKSDSLLYVYHNRQLVSQKPYRLSNGRLPRCSARIYALLYYVTNLTVEPAFWNNDLKEYIILQNGAGAILTIRGEHECLDGGFTERYHWQSE